MNRGEIGYKGYAVTEDMLDISSRACDYRSCTVFQMRGSDDLVGR